MAPSSAAQFWNHSCAIALPDEIVSVTTPSTAETADILRSFAGDSVKLKINQQNLEALRLRTAISLCTGDVIALGDRMMFA